MSRKILIRIMNVSNGCFAVNWPSNGRKVEEHVKTYDDALALALVRYRLAGGEALVKDHTGSPPGKVLDITASIA